jgi:hypothetical protein
MSTTKNMESFWTKPVKNVYLKWVVRYGVELVFWAMGIIILLSVAIAMGQSTNTTDFSNEQIFDFLGLALGLICIATAVILGKQNQILNEIEKNQVK